MFCFPQTALRRTIWSSFTTRVAPVLLPHLAGRPLSLKRFPDDIHGEAFWEKDAPNFTPGWIQRYSVPRKHENSVIRYMGLTDAKSLRWAASIGCIEIHSFLHCYPYITSPTLIAFDLDPGPGMTAIDCCSVALELRDWFDRWHLRTFVKVSGSKGLQVYVPLNTPSAYAVTQLLARKVAEELERRNPDRIISRMARAARGGKVFIDWSQNAEHKTTVSVYSMRAKSEHPYVSTPLTWDEVESAASARRLNDLVFSPERALAHIQERGDLFRHVLTLKQTIPQALRAALRLPAVPPAKRVQVREARAPQDAVPRSSGQGGRKLFVIHHRSETFELGIEHNDSFFLFELPRIPTRRGQRIVAAPTTTRSLEYLTEESSNAGIVWDLGTYELVEGSLAKGHAEIFISGRRLTGEWTIALDQASCTITNRSIHLLRGLRPNASALAGIRGTEHAKDLPRAS